MSQDKFQGRVFQWIKGEFEGQFERVLETRDGMLIFESDTESNPRRIRIPVLREFMIEHGVFGSDIPVDTETGQEIPAAPQPQVAVEAAPQLIGEEAVIFNLLEKQKQFDHIELDLRIKLPILTSKAYDFLLSTFDQEVISSAIIKKASKDIDEQLKSLAATAKAELISGIERKYNRNEIGFKGGEERVREVPQENGHESVSRMESEKP